MWPFSRKAEMASPVEPAPSMPQIHFDWKDLPPIQRSVAELPLTIPTEPFAAELATHQDPRATAQPLGHNLSLEAPAGIVLGIARPQTRTDGPELVPPSRPKRRPVAQRAADESLLGEIETPDVDSGAVEEPPAPPAPPLRRLAVSTEPLPSVQLTSVAPDNGPQPLAPLSDVVIGGEAPPAATIETAETEASGGAAHELPTYPRLTLGQARRLGLGPPLARVPDSATPIQRSSEPSLPPAPPAPLSEAREQAEPAPQFQPFLLDFLINKRPEVAAPAPISRPQRIPKPLPVSRSVSLEPSPESKPASEPVQTAPSAPEVTAWTSPQAPGESLAGPSDIVAATDPTRSMLTETAMGETDEGTTVPLSPLPLAARAVAPLAAGEPHLGVEALPSAGVGRSDISMALSPADVPPTMPAEVPAVAPLISESPKLATAVRRATAWVPSVTRADSAPPAIQRTATGDAGGPGGVRIHRGAEAAVRTAAMDARAFTERGEVFLPESHGPLDLMPGRALLAHELVHVGQQGRQDAALSVGDSEDGRRLEAEALTVERAVAANAPLPLARWSSPSGQTTPRVQPTPSMQTSSALPAWPAAETASAGLQSAIDDGMPSTIQRAPIHDWTVSAAADLSSASATAGTPAAGEPAAHGRDEEARIEELAGQLYDRIRIRLRNELLVDRERAGFLTDLR